ncbi:hypothetical protein DdX_21452 [Ditylenchus destructor]|uniref:Uncharacterized protein n=1 Tax=Ditylenchus destructor TaxID=166010 RepID=A0AAD4MFP3_9BILA|nr:hypothetical protein DdX_21452 [Ditylenchus destructor]
MTDVSTTELLAQISQTSPGNATKESGSKEAQVFGCHAQIRVVILVCQGFTSVGIAFGYRGKAMLHSSSWNATDTAKLHICFSNAIARFPLKRQDNRSYCLG